MSIRYRRGPIPGPVIIEATGRAATTLRLPFNPTPIEIQLEMLTICGRKYPNGPLLLMAVKSPHWLGICAIITSVFMLIAL